MTTSKTALPTALPTTAAALPATTALPATVIVISALLACAGCSKLGVKPWDRDLLAKPEMQMGSEALEIATDEHLYFSKEATSGGRGFAGGGCGCN